MKITVKTMELECGITRLAIEDQEGNVLILLGREVIENGETEKEG